MAVGVQLFDEYQRICPRTGKRLEADAPPLGERVSLAAGRGEFASFQVVLGPFEKPGGTATVKPSALVGPGTIPARQFDVLVQWYVAYDPDAHRSGRIASAKRREQMTLVPDGLVPLEAFGGRVPLGERRNEVPGQHYQALWVDLFVPADAKYGRYEGALEVGVGRDVHSVPVELEVLGFRCPDAPSFTLLMNNYADAISAGWADLREDLDRHRTGRYRRIERTFWRTAHDHRCVFYYLPYTHSGYIYPTFAPPLVGGGAQKRVKSWADWDRHFGGYFDGTAFRGSRRGEIPVPRFFLPISLTWPADFLKWGRPGYAAEFKAVMGQVAEHFKARGWTRTCFDMFLNHKQRYKLFPWDCEEMRFLEDLEVHRTFRKLWAGTLDHRTTRPVRFDYTIGDTWTVGINLRNDLSEFIDVFIGGSRTTAWYPKRVAALKRRGTHFCACGGGCSLASTRTAAFWPLQFWVWGADSFMVWTSMMWGADPWHAPPGTGRLLLLYPGDFFGLDSALPSLRLKVLRNTLQTIERLTAAARTAKGGRRAVLRAVCRTMGRKDLSEWVPAKPAYMDTKPPKDWTNADFATEEPPLADWQDTRVQQYKRLAALAGEMVGRATGG
jgi:hypothetical protein